MEDAALFDRCARTLTDYDIGVLVGHLFTGKYRYIGNETWEWRDANAWQPDPRGKRFVNDVKYTIHGLACQRAYHWQQIANAQLDADAQPDADTQPNALATAEAHVERLLKFGKHIMKKNMARNAVDEARAFLDGDGYRDG